MATISVGSFVPIPGQTVCLSDKASTRFGGRPIRLLITGESKPAPAAMGQRHLATTSDWLAISGYELGPRGERLRHHRDVVVYAPAIVICGDPGVRYTR
ncbi:hypothetical protein [Actinocatenispora sera]|uniref:Uncharacterized protein n=1 Tax=Actinocatenispora sera TaxID=390989 RepID=A0A810KUH4_9ACTN|nr:hypothetical protein [Actinocatenispora sera]BCJ26883.1 hypothetical protein Asera_09910 [Actinocatenispora sera]